MVAKDKSLACPRMDCPQYLDVAGSVSGSALGNSEGALCFVAFFFFLKTWTPATQVGLELGV